MAWKAQAAKWLARRVTASVLHRAMDPVATQRAVLRKLIAGGQHSAFGKEHRLDRVTDHTGLVQAVPLRDYEGLRPWIERIVHGERDVLWPGLPLYLCKTSGTTSGAKYIPITKASLPNHIGSARRALLAYIAHSGNTGFVDGKMIFLQGSPVLDRKGAIPSGRLSGIVANHVPRYLQKNRLPSFATNSIADWETKVEAIVGETMHADLRLISGIPAWVQMYFERLLARTGKANLREVFPDFSLFVYGGVNYAPYRSRMEALIGGSVDSVELFPASEGFIAYQDQGPDEGLLLVLDSGIYYEFIPVGELGNAACATPLHRRGGAGRELRVGAAHQCRALGLRDRRHGEVHIAETAAHQGDRPHQALHQRLRRARDRRGGGRRVEGGLGRAALRGGRVHRGPAAFAPAEDGLPYHEWFIEFAAPPADMDAFATAMDQALQTAQPLLQGPDHRQGAAPLGDHRRCRAAASPLG
jgi:hypothetical protein